MNEDSTSEEALAPSPEEAEVATGQTRFKSFLMKALRRIRRLPDFIESLNPNSVIALFTIITAIATVCIAYTTTKQWAIMGEQSAQTDAIIDQMRLEKRAWLSVTKPKIENLEVDTLHVFQLTIRNTGSLPGTAVSLSTYTFTTPVGEDIQPRFNQLDHREVRPVFAPESLTQVPVRGVTPFTEDVLEAINAPNKTHELYLIGLLKYDDGLGELRQTQFCYRYEAEELRACHQYNTMD